MIEVRVPASTANMGAGFDSFATALNLYNIITVRETESGLKIRNKNPNEGIPTDENNLIYRAMERIFEYTGYRRKGIEITQKSHIPKTRGLGSSSACIVGGMVAANVLAGKKLSYREILKLATEMEGHPDNVAAALYGGFCISAESGGDIIVKSIKLKKPLAFAAIIPEYFLATKKSRELLPEAVSLADAAHNIARAAGLAAAMASGNYENLREYVNDKIHQPYRAGNIEGMYDIFDAGYEMGARAMCLSGSGPTVIAMADNGAEFCKKMEEYLTSENKKYRLLNLSADNVGTVVKYKTY